jgi:hypothetical protein
MLFFCKLLYIRVIKFFLHICKLTTIVLQDFFDFFVCGLFNDSVCRVVCVRRLLNNDMESVDGSDNILLYLLFQNVSGRTEENHK